MRAFASKTEAEKDLKAEEAKNADKTKAKKQQEDSSSSSSSDEEAGSESLSKDDVKKIKQLIAD